MPRLRSPDIFGCCILIAGLLGCGSVAFATNTVVRLASGDQVSGTVISETTNFLVLSNSWISEVFIPQNQIVFRGTHLPPIAAMIESNRQRVVKQAGAAAKASADSAQTNRWKGEAQMGLDLVYGAKDRQIFHGRFKLLYLKPYKRDPKKLFRNSIDASAEYGKTDGVKSSDRVNLSDKTVFDLEHHWYVYNLVAGGYDHILKINAQYEAGPGVGYHLFTHTNFTMNVEGGLNYQAQFRSGGSDLQDVYYRFAEDFAWKLRSRLTLTEKFEITPRINFTSLRARFETTLSYELWRNLSLNLTLLDFYDTQPAENISRNELQIRSALGVKF
jgi:hypothetical protein